ncbi:hypothetical protein [uncultured Helicobacter sp.]|uniref:hypothetical protein n=1 Tax=uncultured Helicobacter sp. TaxID=175537 RepID=UPI00258F4377|nr:hypothetical protein [uncultured Helicobacter sp.]
MIKRSKPSARTNALNFSKKLRFVSFEAKIKHAATAIPKRVGFLMRNVGCKAKRKGVT